MNALDEQHGQCPAAGCTHDRDPKFGLCWRCRGVVPRFRIDEIDDAHRDIQKASDTNSKARAIRMWNEAIEKATGIADAWRRDHAAR